MTRASIQHRLVSWFARADADLAAAAPVRDRVRGDDGSRDRLRAAHDAGLRAGTARQAGRPDRCERSATHRRSTTRLRRRCRFSILHRSISFTPEIDAVLHAARSTDDDLAAASPARSGRAAARRAAADAIGGFHARARDRGHATQFRNIPSYRAVCASRARCV